MHTPVWPVALALLVLPLAGAAAETPRETPTTLQPFVVKESRAEAFYLRVAEGEVTRLWFVSLDRPGSSSLPADARHLKTVGSLVPYRSLDLHPGDELLAIAGRPVTRMTWNEFHRALRTASDQPPVIVTVRAPGSSVERSASVVLHTAVTLGAKVLPAAKSP